MHRLPTHHRAIHLSRSRIVPSCGVGVNVCGAGMVLGWNVFEDDARTCCIGFNLYPSQHQEDLRLHVHGWKGLFVRVSYVTGM